MRGKIDTRYARYRIRHPVLIMHTMDGRMARVIDYVYATCASTETDQWNTCSLFLSLAYPEAFRTA